MDEESSNQGFAITSKHLGFLITMFTVLGIVYSIINTAVTFTNKIETMEKEYTEVSDQLDKFQSKIDLLNDKVVDLANNVTRLDERLNSRMSQPPKIR